MKKKRKMRRKGLAWFHFRHVRNGSFDSAYTLAPGYFPAVAQVFMKSLTLFHVKKLRRWCDEAIKEVEGRVR